MTKRSDSSEAPFWAKCTLKEALAATDTEIVKHALDFCENYRDWDEGTFHPNVNFLAAMKKLLSENFKSRGGQEGPEEETLAFAEKALVMRASSNKTWATIAAEIGYASRQNDNFESRVQQLQKISAKLRQTVLLKLAGEALRQLNDEQGLTPSP